MIKFVFSDFYLLALKICQGPLLMIQLSKASPASVFFLLDDVALFWMPSVSAPWFLSSAPLETLLPLAQVELLCILMS